MLFFWFCSVFFPLHLGSQNFNEVLQPSPSAYICDNVSPSLLLPHLGNQSSSRHVTGSGMGRRGWAEPNSWMPFLLLRERVFSMVVTLLEPPG